jgi:hypothetical protein
MKGNKRDAGCCVKPIKGATNNAKACCDMAMPIKGAVALQPKNQGLARIKGTVNWPK